MKIKLNEFAEIIYFDKNAELVTGYTEKEVIGQNWFKIFIADIDRNEVKGVFSDFIHGHIHEWEHINSIKCKNGSKKINWSNNLIITDKHSIIESIGEEIL